MAEFDAHCCHMGGTAIKHPVPDQSWASECPDVKKLQMTA